VEVIRRGGGGGRRLEWVSSLFVAVVFSAANFLPNSFKLAI
jgi:hypothetical protein